MIDLRVGDALEELKKLPSGSVHCCVTSPPYWGLRDYGVQGQIGLEKTPEEYVQRLLEVFREVKRVLRDDGTLWLNLGDSYAGSGRGMNGDGFPGKIPSKKQQSNAGSNIDLHDKRVAAGAIGRFWVSPPPGLKQKDLVGIPWRIAFALQADGWYLRSDIIWNKPNPMPESVTDRPTKSHEYIFLLTKSSTYFYDQDAIREPFNYPERTYNPDTSDHKTAELKQIGNRSTAGLHDGRTKYGNPSIGRNKRSVWTMNTMPYPEAHFATFPPELPKTCIKAGCPKDGVVLDPFAGSGTTGWVARSLGRKAILIEINPRYGELIEERTMSNVPDIMNFRSAEIGMERGQ